MRQWRRAIGDGLARRSNGLRRVSVATLSIVALALSVSFSNGVTANLERAIIDAAQTPTAAVAVEAADATASPEAAVEAAPSPTPTVAPPAPTPSPTPVPERSQPSGRGGSALRGARTIVVDPGHGGNETGAKQVLADGSTMYEKNLNLRVGLAAAELLRAAGHRVIVTRDADTAVNAEGRDLNGDGKVNVIDDLQARVDLANRERADLFVSVHFNAGRSGAHGAEVFFNADRPFAEQSRRLAAAIYDRLYWAVREGDYDLLGHGVKRDAQATGGDPFYVLGPAGGLIARAGNMPAALGEALYLTYPAETELLRRDDFLLRLARAYADGILDYLAAE